MRRSFRTPPLSHFDLWIDPRDHQEDCIQFRKIAIVVLNQVIRPFTVKWHRLSLAGAFNDRITA